MAKSKSRKSNQKSFSKKKKYVSTRKSRTKKRKNLSLNKYQKGGSTQVAPKAPKTSKTPDIKIYDSYGNELRYYDNDKRYHLHLALDLRSNGDLYDSICENIDKTNNLKMIRIISEDKVVFDSKIQGRNKYLHECITIFNVIKREMNKDDKNYKLDIILKNKIKHFSYSLGRELTKKDNKFLHDYLRPYRIEYNGNNNYHLIVKPSP